MVRFREDKVRGEIVLILSPSEQVPKLSMTEALRHLLEESDLTRKEAVKLIAKEYGLPSSDVYRASLKLTDEGMSDEV